MPGGRRRAAGATALALAGALGAAAWAGDAGRGRAWVGRWDAAGPAVQERDWVLRAGEWPGELGALGGALWRGGLLPRGVQVRVSHAAALPLDFEWQLVCLAPAEAAGGSGGGGPGGGRELRDAEVAQVSSGGCVGGGGAPGGLPGKAALRINLQVWSRSVETQVGRLGGGAAGGAWYAVRAVPTLGGVPLDVLPFAATALAAVFCGLTLAEVSARSVAGGLGGAGGELEGQGRKGRALLGRD